METKNPHRVAGETWRRWSKPARAVFNSVYEQMVRDQELFLHPKQKKASPEHWRTTSWNAAWAAANAVDGQTTAGEAEAA